jgi:hypothetical protein
MPAEQMKAPEESDKTKRPRGRPTVGAGTGGFKRVMLAMYQEQLDIADRIHHQRSVAVRLALEYWAENNPQTTPRETT